MKYRIFLDFQILWFTFDLHNWFYLYSFLMSYPLAYSINSHRELSLTFRYLIFHWYLKQHFPKLFKFMRFQLIYLQFLISAFHKSILNFRCIRFMSCYLNQIFNYHFLNSLALFFLLNPILPWDPHEFDDAFLEFLMIFHSFHLIFSRQHFPLILHISNFSMMVFFKGSLAPQLKKIELYSDHY